MLIQAENLLFTVSSYIKKEPSSLSLINPTVTPFCEWFTVNFHMKFTWLFAMLFIDFDQYSN